MESTPVLKTSHLLLTQLQLSDAPAIQGLLPHWQVARYLYRLVPWPYLDDGALTYVRDVALTTIAAGRKWHSMICLASDPEQKTSSTSLYDEPGNNRGFWLSSR